MTTTMATATIAAAHPPATPRYILRGHASPIHALHFFAQNSLLISADADGWVIIWDVVTKRPRAVWKAHEGSVSEVKGFSLHGDEGGEGMEVFTYVLLPCFLFYPFYIFFIC
jgi:WD40 repeat protein